MLLRYIVDGILLIFEFHAAHLVVEFKTMRLMVLVVETAGF